MISTLLGLLVVTGLAVGIRLLLMETVQQRRQRENRQINERLRTLIAAYKALGGSFTGNLAVDPTHLRDFLSRRALPESDGGGGDGDGRAPRGRGFLRAFAPHPRCRRSGALGRDPARHRGTGRLAAQAATDLVAGRPIHTDELVISLRDFIRKVLDLEPVQKEAAIPKQGPTRAAGAGVPRRKGLGGRQRWRPGRHEAGRPKARVPGGGDGAAGGGMGMGLGMVVGGRAEDHEGHAA